MEDDMAWVEFTSDHDHRPTHRVTIAFKAGTRVPVTHTCRDEAIALGRAFEIPKPNREDANAATAGEGSARPDYGPATGDGL